MSDEIQAAEAATVGAKTDMDPPPSAQPVRNPKPTYADTLAFVKASPNEALEIYHSLDKALVEIGALERINVGEAET